MLALYHFAEAICAQKVRLALAEKGMPWESRDCVGPALRDPEYLKLNPSGVVPTLVHDDKVLTESRIISEYVAEAFDGPVLLPSNPHGRYRARYWTKQIDDSLHLNVFILTFAGGARDLFLKMPPEVRAVSLPGLRDPIKRRISNELLDQGWESPLVASSVDRFRRLVNDMENCLAQSTYLGGSGYSLADADYTAYINRLADLGFEGLWAGKPGVQDWWARMRQRASYQVAIADWTELQDSQRYARFRERYADSVRMLIAGA